MPTMLSTTASPSSSVEPPALLVENNKGSDADGGRNLTSYIPIRPTIAASQRASPPSNDNSTIKSTLPVSPPRKKASTSTSPVKQQQPLVPPSSIQPPAPARNKPSTSPLPQSSLAASLLTPAALRRANNNKANTQKNNDLNSVVSSSLFPSENVDQPEQPHTQNNIDDDDAIEVFENENNNPINEQTDVTTPTRTHGGEEDGRGEEEVGGTKYMGASSAPVKASRKMAKLKNFRKNTNAVNNEQASSGGQSSNLTIEKKAAGPRSYPLSNKLNVFIVSDDPRLNKYASAFGVIEYNGHDAFEFGAVGQVTAKLDARPPPPGSPLEKHEQLEALFTFRQLDDFHPDDVAKAKANTEQLLRQLEKDVALRLQHATNSAAEQSAYHQPPSEPSLSPSPVPVNTAPPALDDQHVEQSSPRLSRGRRDGDTTAAPKSRRMRGMKLKDLRGGSRV
jgi:hypothetical protein